MIILQEPALLPDLSCEEAARLFGEPAFRGIVRLAAAACSTPIAAIAAREGSSYRFKALQGLESDPPTEDAMTKSLLQHIAGTQNFFAVGDLLSDDRFAKNQVPGFNPAFRFFAGIPIQQERGKILGILVVMDSEVRRVDCHLQNVLRELAEHAVNLLREKAHTADLTRAIESSELRFQSVWEKSVDGMRLTDEYGTVVAVNEAFCRLVGLPREALLDRPFTATYAETEQLEEILRKYRERFQSRNIEVMIERRLTFRSGRSVDLEVTSSFIDLPGKKPLLLGLFRDITDKKRAEGALLKSESQFRLVWENALDGLRLTDESGICRVINDAYCRLVNKRRDELSGFPLSVAYHPAAGGDILREHRERFKTRTIIPTLERSVTLWNGKTIFVQVSNSFLEIAGEAPLLLSIFRDLTENKQVQGRMQKLEQQRALEKERDRIARDMHDELGGTLTRITLLTEVVGSLVNKGSERQELQSRLQKISAMSRDVIRNMDEIVWAVNPVNDSLENFASYLCHFTNELFKMTSINCRLDVPPIFPHRCVRSEVRHNLFLAVKEGLNNVARHSQAREVSLHMEMEGDFFTICVTDDGVGFDTAQVNRFSNGLANMQNRIKDIGGSIEIRSRKNRGTSITMRFEPAPPTP